MTDRAQSDTLGFVLLFTVLIASLGVVATAGVGTLESGRDVATSQNVEQSMIELAGAGTDVHRENVSVRTARMGLGNGQLEAGEETEIAVEVDGSPADVGGTRIDGLAVQPITYSLDGRAVTYEGTAVVRHQDGGSVLVREPDFHFDPDGGVVAVPVVNTTLVGDADSVGGGNAEVRLLRGDASTRITDSATSFTLTVDPPADRVDAWKTALESSAESSTDCSEDESSGTVSYECPSLGPDEPTIVLRLVTVAFELSG
ncbi:DUF7289 family protein [Halomicrobium urmianum]|uniref:DUF7289 family protein n=1 Tax=Halomicrobium urmianum TaxID=1586233 RepID=UPI001CD969D4|nr:hypothetical protein [Halomicrobium urmianum]